MVEIHNTLRDRIKSMEKKEKSRFVEIKKGDHNYDGPVAIFEKQDNRQFIGGKNDKILVKRFLAVNLLKCK